MGSQVRRALSILIALAAFLPAYAPDRHALAAAAEAPVPVRVAVAEPSPKAGEIRATGTLAFKREMTLGFKTAGILKGFEVEAGDTVEAGALLALLDPAEVGARSRDAQAAFANAEAAYRRALDLHEKGFAAQARLDEAKAALERARAARDASAFDAAKAELRAPAAGVVLSRLAEPNEVMAPGTPVLVFGDASAGLIVTAPVSDVQITRLRGGDRAKVAFAGLPPLEAAVARLAAKADLRTGAFDVELRLAALAPGLRSGLVGEARIVPSVRDRQSEYPAIPAIALLEGRGDRAGVFVVDKDGKARRRSVLIAGFVDDLVLIAEGLARGEKVVTSGAPYLRNGQGVVVVSDGPGQS